jgi:hypothetical protein
VPDRIPQKPAEYAGHAVHAVVGHHSHGLLVGPVPHGQTQHEARVHDRLKGSQQKPVGSYAGEVRACRSRDDE